MILCSMYCTQTQEMLKLKKKTVKELWTEDLNVFLEELEVRSVTECICYHQTGTETRKKRK